MSPIKVDIFEIEVFQVRYNYVLQSLSLIYLIHERVFRALQQGLI